MNGLIWNKHLMSRLSFAPSPRVISAQVKASKMSSLPSTQSSGQPALPERDLAQPQEQLVSIPMDRLDTPDDPVNQSSQAREREEQALERVAREREAEERFDKMVFGIIFLVPMVIIWVLVIFYLVMLRW